MRRQMTADERGDVVLVVAPPSMMLVIIAMCYGIPARFEKPSKHST